MPESEPQSNIVSVAKQLREDFISYCNTAPEHKWPPNFESVTTEFGDPPGSVKLFLKKLQQRRAEQTERKHVASLIHLHQISFIISVLERSLPQNIIYQLWDCIILPDRNTQLL